MIFNVSTRVHVQILVQFDGEMREGSIWEIFDVTERGVRPTRMYGYTIVMIFFLLHCIH